MEPPGAPIPRPPAEAFGVLCGPDFAGKSTVMTELARGNFPVRPVSVDTVLLGPRDAVISDVRRATLAMLPDLGGAHSRELVLSMLQVAIVHLRDHVAAGGAPAVVDSYYYKILAKCRLLGIDDHPMYAWWRTFPRPARVFWLDVHPDTAWQRCGGRANRLEHYGPRLDQDSFGTFQRELRKLMLDEIADLDVVFLPEGADPADIARTLVEAFEHGR